ncbi:MAG TPA: PfkB family carbohydrate kinase [Acidobacteriaceae bacterium]|nr:PfkB family carbohydrate kinase [Acidobacteriaceae bacterium]
MTSSGNGAGAPVVNTAATMVDLVGVGLNCIDTVIPLEEFPKPGAKIEYSNEMILPGGQVATTVAACQQWGLKTRYVGKLGEDAAAEFHYREFARTGVEARIAVVPGAASAQHLILVDRQGERTVLGRLDERLDLKPEDLKREWIVNARALHVDGHDTAAATLAAGWAREAGVPVVADLDELYPGVEELLNRIDYLIVSRDFPTRLTGLSRVEDALKEMRSRYGSRLTAATLGEEGVLAWDGERMHYAPAYRVGVMDTTGAGDVFHAGFIFGLLQEWQLAQTLDFACAAAALNCTGVGARGGIQDRERVEALMAAGTRLPAWSTSIAR